MSAALPKEETEVSLKEEEAKKAKEESDFKSYERSPSLNMFLQTRDLHLELTIILHRVSLKLLQLNEGLTSVVSQWKSFPLSFLQICSNRLYYIKVNLQDLQMCWLKQTLGVCK